MQMQHQTVIKRSFAGRMRRKRKGEERDGVSVVHWSPSSLRPLMLLPSCLLYEDKDQEARDEQLIPYSGPDA